MEGVSSETSWRIQLVIETKQNHIEYPLRVLFFMHELNKRETAKSQNLPEDRTASFFVEKKSEIERLEKRKAELMEELSAIDKTRVARETAHADLEKLPAEIESAREAKDKKTMQRVWEYCVKTNKIFSPRLQYLVYGKKMAV